MPTNNLLQHLHTLKNQRQICVIGAAVIDVIADAYSLPHRGSDIELHQQGVNIGGCALNIAVTLKQLGMSSLNALPVGQGIWADIIRHALKEKDINSVIQTEKGDNGWCLALIEPDGERTFLSVSGVENQWTTDMLSQLTIDPHALVYLSGYQLTSACGDVLIRWLETLPHSTTLFIDFGPRIADIAPDRLARVLARNPIISLNREEAGHLLKTDSDAELTAQEVEILVANWSQRHRCPLIVRLDKEGAYYRHAQQAGWVSPVQAQVVDTIGAGDSHAGGVLAGLASGWSLQQAVMLGNAVASFVVSHRGGDCAPSRRQLSEYLQARET
ncbi:MULTISPECIES: PfkB family carbohydrate kinase [unclassified Brenneria]|uniref:PfkB family carbohydrate kinase n=1 Tax=unclassified Brenneria TaxID=2634434 RepID=UPI001552488D|nr:MULTISPECIES: PfkB family carbohydrate kinase [unclassified Brenneria]MBJ7222900.1 sugar kinase [Brenneria sp. L3-3C-1]MEE3644139.1 PfkB family carbohydrate kinase [Brenneria sp. L3_3C_1]MEE3651754.1 PfkB family carbohydrate kinase [Brenneria sp. HEZEL_4_2_4]NPD01710.1 sugar kinase [Brenneria sp. hezel4-2-4]